MCRLFGFSKQAYYKRINRKVSVEYKEVKSLVMNVRSQLPRSGGRKIHHMISDELKAIMSAGLVFVYDYKLFNYNDQYFNVECPVCDQTSYCDTDEFRSNCIIPSQCKTPWAPPLCLHISANDILNQEELKQVYYSKQFSKICDMKNPRGNPTIAGNEAAASLDAGTGELGTEAAAPAVAGARADS